MITSSHHRHHAPHHRTATFHRAVHPRAPDPAARLLLPHLRDQTLQGPEVDGPGYHALANDEARSSGDRERVRQLQVARDGVLDGRVLHVLLETLGVEPDRT